MNIKNLDFPVITFDKNNNIFYAKNTNDLEICSKRGFEQGFYKGLLIIDIEGNEYLIEDAKKVENVGVLFGFNIFLSQKIKVELIFNQSIVTIDLKEFKEKLINAYNLNRSFWDSGGDLDNIIKYIKDTDSIKTIIEDLSLDFYKKY